MKKPPLDWPQIAPALFYREPLGAIDWLCKAFGFAVRMKLLGEEGALLHSELTLGEGLIMVAGEEPKPGASEGDHRRSPKSLGGANTQRLMVYVDDADAHCARARSQGARILSEPQTTDYGEEHWSDRGYEAEDPEGHRWWFAERIRSPK